jgi:hypothetical protein
MMTIDQAAELIAVAVCEHRAVAAGIPRSDFEPFRAAALKPIRDAYFNIIVQAFERGEIRLHSATSLLPIPPALGVGVGVLSGRVQADEVNRWLITIGVPISIKQPTITPEAPASASKKAKPVLWHRDPAWRQKIFDCANAVAEENLTRRWGGTNPRDVMEQVAVRMANEKGFQRRAAKSILKYVLYAHRGMPGWTFKFVAKNAQDPVALSDGQTPPASGALEQTGAGLGASTDPLEKNA